MLSITYDWQRESDPPGPGDVLVAMRRNGQPSGSNYLILTAREVRRRDPVPGVVRMHYRVARVTAWERGTRSETLVWNKR